MSLFPSPQKLFQSGLDLLFPAACVHCKAPNAWLCQNCKASIPFITSIICSRCGTPLTSSPCPQCIKNSLHYIDGIRCATYFQDNPIRSAVHDLKYRGRKVIAEALGEFLAETYRHYNLKVDLLMPVPLYKTRYKERGFNQSLLLANQLSRLVNVPVDSITLYRTRDTGHQMALKASERHNNVANAFECRRPITGRSVLLIDDVCTTGATLDFCAMSLKTNGAASVWGLTLAKAQ